MDFSEKESNNEELTSLEVIPKKNAIKSVNRKNDDKIKKSYFH